MLFEVYDLQYASPATISRCGMVYVDPKNLGYAPFFEKWMTQFNAKKDKYEILIETFNELFQKYFYCFTLRYIPNLITLIFEGGISEEEMGKPL